MTENPNVLQDYFLAGIIHTLRSLKILQQEETESLDTIDFDYLIERRVRDMEDQSILETIEQVDDKELQEYK